MKKLLLLIFVLCSCLSIKAQADCDQKIFVFSNGDGSYDQTYNTNFIDMLGTESIPVERVYIKFNAL